MITLGSILQKKGVQWGLWVVAALVIVYGMIYVDVVLRAKHAYQEGEKYTQWHSDPLEKQKALKEQFLKLKKDWDKKLKKEKITQKEYNRQIEILEFDHQRQLKESAIKYAYVWYKTAYELFSPPESKWVRLSREKAPVAKEQWKEELRSKNIPFEEYMLD